MRWLEALRAGDVRDKRAFPDLGRILAGIQRGDRIGVGDFGMLGASAVWAWAARILVAKCISVEDCTTRFVLDFSQPAAPADVKGALASVTKASADLASVIAPKGN